MKLNYNLIKGAAVALAALFLMAIFAIGCRITNDYKIEAVCHIQGKTAYFITDEYRCGNVFAWNIEDGDEFVEGKTYTLVMDSKGTDNTSTDDIIKKVLANK